MIIQFLVSLAATLSFAVLFSAEKKQLFSCFLIACPAASGNVAADNALDRKHFQLTAHHAVSVKFLLLEKFRHVFYVYRDL